MLARMGDSNVRTSKDDLNAVEVTVASVVAHPSYQMGTPYHDVAVVQLSEPMMMSSFIKTVCLPTKPRVGLDNRAREFATMAGWGIEEKGISTATIGPLRSLDVAIHPQ